MLAHASLVMVLVPPAMDCPEQNVILVIPLPLNGLTLFTVPVLLLAVQVSTLTLLILHARTAMQHVLSAMDLLVLNVHLVPLRPQSGMMHFILHVSALVHPELSRTLTVPASHAT